MNKTVLNQLNIRWLGKVSYTDALSLQNALFEEGSENHLLLLEHQHVFTLGVRGEKENILVEEKGLTPTLASAKLSVLFNALLIPSSVSAHEENPEDLLAKILKLQEFINVKKSPENE